MPSCSCRKKPLRLPGFGECVNTTSVSVCKRVHRPRINFARDRDSRIETGGRMKYSRERPKYWGRASIRRCTPGNAVNFTSDPVVAAYDLFCGFNQNETTALFVL